MPLISWSLVWQLPFLLWLISLPIRPDSLVASTLRNKMYIVIWIALTQCDGCGSWETGLTSMFYIGTESSTCSSQWRGPGHT